MPNRAVKILRWQATAILTLFFSAVVGAAAVGWWYARDSAPHQGPIVLLAVDGLAHDTLAPRRADERASGLPAGPEDALDEPASALATLAADAVVFERAYTHSPLLLPAYASLVAGRLPFEHGVRDEAGFSLPGEVRTLAELLRNRGFTTGAAVSSNALREGTGIDRGFSFFQDTAREDVLARIDASTPDAPHPPEEPTAIDAAEAWARAQENQRYFLMLQVEADEAEAAVERITALLRERGTYDRSTIVLVGSRGRAGLDAALDEDTLLVPMLVKQPNSEQAGLRIEVPVQHVDLLPTLLDLVRAPIPGELRGRSLKPLLTDEDGRITMEPIYAESLAAYYRFGGHPLFALTVNGVRYVQGPTESLVRLDAPAGPETLEADEAEGSEEPEIEQLRATLDRLLGQDVPRPAAVIPAADVEPLAGLGYLQGLPADPGAGTPVPLDPGDQERLLDSHQAAARLLGLRQYGAAIRSLQALARTRPGLADLHYQIGAIGLHGDRTQEALASLREAAERRPDSPEVASLLAVALARAGRADEARRETERAVALATDLEPERLTAAHVVAARLAIARDDRDAALEHAVAAERLDPALPMRTYVEAVLLARDGDPEAAIAFERAVLHVRQHDQVALEGLHLGLADALADAGRTADAEAAFRDEIRAFPASIPAYTGLAALYHADGRIEAADAAVRALLDVVPTRAAYAAAARTWTTLDERARADAVRLEARERFRGDPGLASRSRDRLR